MAASASSASLFSPPSRVGPCVFCGNYIRVGTQVKNNISGFVKSPPAAVRFNFFMRSLRGDALRDLTPQFLRALHPELFTKPACPCLFKDPAVFFPFRPFAVSPFPFSPFFF
jgi:hypothetical protein